MQKSIEEDKLEVENDPKKSRFVVAKVEELNNIGTGHGKACLPLFIKNGKARDGQINCGFEFGGLESPS